MKKEKLNLESCPFCGSSNIKDCYVFIKCLDCLAEGPKINNGRYDDHADFVDHENAIKAWNCGKKRYPKFIKRLYDGAILSINDDGTYSFDEQRISMPTTFYKYTYKNLMVDLKKFFEEA